MNSDPVPSVTDWHAHVYYTEASFERAQALCERAAAELPVSMGRLHKRPVGPHPDWSCQLSFAPSDFGTVVPWLNLRRDGLVVFVHPNTGAPIPDHRDRAIWLGDSRPLDLAALG